jgi:hypothetical protein
MLRNSLEQVTKEMTINHYFKAEESIDQAEKKQEAVEEKRKDFPTFKTPAPAPKKLEQTRLPGTEEPPKKAIIMSYGENDQVPPWIVVGADVSVCAYPGGKPYLQTQITGPVYLERMTKQKCVMVANVSYPVPVSCLQQKEAV